MTGLGRDILSLHGDKDQQGRKRPPFLLLIFILTLCTSSLAGYVLGKKSDIRYSGQLIDTILLTLEAEQEKSAILHLTGRVLYSDGTPAAGRTLELHSEPIRTVTDSAGAFLFDHVPLGEHSLAVMNDDGTMAARRNVVLDRTQAGKGISVDLNGEGVYVVELAMDVRMLEMYIELDADNYYINPENVTYATTDGMVVTPDGRASITDGAVVTPAGNVCLPDGTIVMSGKRKEDPTAVILPDDTVIFPQEKLVAGNAAILPDGTVNLPQGTVIGPDGEIHIPDGTVKNPGTGGVIVSGQEVRPIGGAQEQASQTGTVQGGSLDGTGAGEGMVSGTINMDVPDIMNGNTGAGQGETSGPGSIPENPSDKSQEGAGGTEGQESQGADSGGVGNNGGSGGNNGGSGGNSGGSGGNNGGSGNSGNTPPESPPETTADPDKGILDVLEMQRDTSGYKSWTQLSGIDLFYNREGGPQEPVLPGSQGYYQFRLKNTRNESLSIRLIMTEGEVHLPLSFTLTPQNSGIWPDKTGTATGTLGRDGSGLVLETEIGPGEEKDFKLDWQWPFEGNEHADTEAGKAGKDYMLVLTVHAEGADR